MINLILKQKKKENEKIFGDDGIKIENLKEKEQGNSQNSKGGIGKQNS